MFQNGVLLQDKLELPSETTTYCRLCLSKDNLVKLAPVGRNSAPIQHDEDKTGQASQLIELIFECTNVLLSLEDEPRCAICLSCQRALTEFYRFRSQAKRVDELIKSKLTETTTTTKEISEASVTDKTEQQKQLHKSKPTEEGDKNVPNDSTIINKLLSTVDRKRTILLGEARKSVGFLAVGIKRQRLKVPSPVIVTAHGDSGMYKCRYCPKSFKTATGLTEHARIHNRPHQCSNCLEQFQHAPSLARHIRNRTCFTFTKYRCRVCTESFLEQAHWAEHIKIHADDFPYQCQECLSQFKHKATLRRHVNTVHLLQY